MMIIAGDIPILICFRAMNNSVERPMRNTTLTMFIINMVELVIGIIQIRLRIFFAKLYIFFGFWKIMSYF